MAKSKHAAEYLRPGKIVLISSPSGGGKTSLCKRLLSPGRKKEGWKFSISFTTRQKRKGERNGKEYYFVDDQQFRALIGKDYFAEHFKVHLYRYGTPRKTIESTIEKGGVLLLDIDVKGALKIKREYPDAITIFVLPPSITALKKRLKARGTETSEQLKVRFENAKKEMKLYRKFEYTIINDILNQAVNEVLGCIASHHCSRKNLKVEQIKKIIG